MQQHFFIEGLLPGLNEITRKNRAHWSKGAKLKKQIDWKIRLFIRHAGLKPVERAQFEFHWMEANKRRDKDNVCGGGRKFILDALQAESILPNDGWKNVEGWSDYFQVSKRPGVLVVMVDLDSKVEGL